MSACTSPTIDAGDTREPRPLVDGRLRRRLGEVVVAEFALVAAMALVAWPTRNTNDIDADIAAKLFAAPGTWVRQAAYIVTYLGSPIAVTVGAATTALWVWHRFRRLRLTIFCPIAVATAGLIEHVLKLVVARPRPSTAVLAHQLDFSYPSGHATASSALAMSLVLLVWSGGPRRFRLLTVVGLGLYVLAVAASRVVLGVHYLSDVVGADALGSAVTLAVGWLCSRPAANVAVADRVGGSPPLVTGCQATSADGHPDYHRRGRAPGFLDGLDQRCRWERCSGGEASEVATAL